VNFRIRGRVSSGAQDGARHADNLPTLAWKARLAA
jgi:hypothetical protein